MSAETLFMRLSDIARIMGGYTFRGKADDPNKLSGLKVIQTRDIREKGYDPAKVSFSVVDKVGSEFFLLPNDILLPLRGDRIESMVFDGGEGDKYITTNQVAMMRVFRELLDPYYLAWYLNSSEGRTRIAAKKSGTTIKNISLKELSGLMVPIPSFSVQEKIVKLYRNWKSREAILQEMLDVGAVVADEACMELIRKNAQR